MADPNMPPLPPGFTLDAPQAPAFGGRPVIQEPAPHPTPQTPEQRASTIAGTAQTQTQITNTAFDNVNSLRKQFEAEQSVQDYKTVLPLMDSALKIQNNKAGDLNLVYAFGKTMDPGSVVREGEQVMATNVGGVSEKVKGYIDQINGQGQLTPIQRTQLTEELRSRARSLQQTYNRRRAFYEDFAKRNGINPNDVIGPHPGQPYEQDEAAYIETHGGTPKIDGAPTQTQGGFDGELPRTNPTPPHAEDFRNGLYKAMRGGRIKSPADMRSWVQQFNQANQTNFSPQLDARETMFAIRAARRGQPFDVEQPKYNPDISDVRGGRDDRFEATARGVLDTPTFGTIDKIVAGTDTLFKGGTMGENLARQYAISDYDAEHHPLARFGGQAMGAALIPMGAMETVPQVALKGAATGTAYGAGSSRSLGDVPMNALLGGAGGAAVGTALSGAGRGLNALAVGAGRRIAGPTTPEQQALMRAGDQENVPVNMGDVYPNLRNTIATQETIPGSSGPIRSGIQAGRDAIERRVGDLGQGGVARGEGALGERVYKGGERFIADHRTTSARDYGTAKKLAGPDFKAPPQEAANAVKSIIGKLSETENINRSTLGFYRDVFKDFIDANGNLKPLSIDAIKNMRRTLRREMTNRGLVGSTEDQELQSVIDAASSDMFNALKAKDPRAAKAYQVADSGYSQRLGFIRDTLQQFMGTKDKPVSGEALVAKIRAMAGSGARGNARQLNSFMSALTNEERADTAATIAAGLGRKSPEEPLSPGMFLSNVRKIDERSRIILFGKSGARSIQNLIKLSTAKQESVARLNNSRSGQVVNYRAMLSNLLVGLPGGGALVGAGAALNGATGAVGGLAIGGGILGASRAFAKALMNEEFTRAVMQAPPTMRPKAIDAHFGRLRQIAAKDPNVRSVVEALEKKLLAHANDNSMRAAAADSPEDQQ